MKRTFRELEKFGELQFESFSNVEDIDGLLATVFDLASKGWAHGENSAISSTLQLQNFYTDLAKVMNEKGWFNCELLSLSGKPIAFEYNLHCDKKSYNLKVGYDKAFSKYSPGMLLKYRVLQEEYCIGTHEYDFLGDVDPYKLRWANGNRTHLKLFIFNSRAYSMYLQWLPLYTKETIKTFFRKQRILSW
jgi:CelD/BcsL family acetyltransferase involved in cellulose biosynthesis